jgi:hypothetical protein
MVANWFEYGKNIGFIGLITLMYGLIIFVKDILKFTNRRIIIAFSWFASGITYTVITSIVLGILVNRYPIGIIIILNSSFLITPIFFLIGIKKLSQI